MNLYFATSNAHKVAEVAAILGAAGLPLKVLPASAVGGMPPVVEDGDTFASNARKKSIALRDQVMASAVASTVRWLVAADDSGLCVDALGGAPGVHSARYAGGSATDDDNNAKLLHALVAVPEANCTAAFYCSIVVANAAGDTHAFTGRCPGRILRQRRGQGGFGYDPLFVPDGCAQTYAELSGDEKNRISHRARALTAFVAWFANFEATRADGGNAS
jgi:XTP/dITP diphosphohydrolase